MLYFILTTYGLSTIVVQSKLFSKLRDFLSEVPFFGSITKCMMCFGFWAALILSVLGLGVASGPLFFIFDSIFGLATTWILHVLVTYVEERTNIG